MKAGDSPFFPILSPHSAAAFREFLREVIHACSHNGLYVSIFHGVMLLSIIPILQLKSAQVPLSDSSCSIVLFQLGLLRDILHHHVPAARAAHAHAAAVGGHGSRCEQRVRVHHFRRIARTDAGGRRCRHDCLNCTVYAGQYRIHWSRAVPLALDRARTRDYRSRPRRRNAPSTEEMQAEFIARYGLTPRETDVLRAVTCDERPLKQIADDLGISLRMVQRHLTNIYEKTDTQTRTGLTKEFMGK